MTTAMITRTEHLSAISRMRIPRLPIDGLIRRCLLAAGPRPNDQAAAPAEPAGGKRQAASHDGGVIV